MNYAVFRLIVAFKKYSRFFYKHFTKVKKNIHKSKIE